MECSVGGEVDVCVGFYQSSYARFAGCAASASRLPSYSLLPRAAVDAVDALLEPRGGCDASSYHANDNSGSIGTAAHCDLWHWYGSALKLHPQFELFRTCR